MAQTLCNWRFVASSWAVWSSRWKPVAKRQPIFAVNVVSLRFMRTPPHNFGTRRPKMSWDISIMDFPKDVHNVAEIPDDYQPALLGARGELIARIHELLPDVNFADPSWGLLDKPGFSIEFNMGVEEVCSSFMLHVRGGGEAMATVASLLRHLQLRGIDCQSGDFFSIQSAQRSFDEWQAYRDRVIDQRSQTDGGGDPNCQRSGQPHAP